MITDGDSPGRDRSSHRRSAALPGRSLSSGPDLEQGPRCGQCVPFWQFAKAGRPGAARPRKGLAALGVDLLGDRVGFYIPGMGRTTSEEWTIAGGHFAERCQAFIIIALGESIVVIGQALSVREHVTAAAVAAFVTAFAGSVALWWIYFDRSAEDGARVIAESPDPGRLANSAYHLIHPVMVAGIIVAASADQEVLAHPAAVGRAGTSWMVVGGAALFLAGHVLFKRVIWGVISWPRVVAIAVLLLLLLAPHVTALALSIVVVLVLVAVAVSDRFSALTH